MELGRRAKKRETQPCLLLQHTEVLFRNLEKHDFEPQKVPSRPLHSNRGSTAARASRDTKTEEATAASFLFFLWTQKGKELNRVSKSSSSSLLCLEFFFCNNIKQTCVHTGDGESGRLTKSWFSICCSYLQNTHFHSRLLACL